MNDEKNSCLRTHDLCVTRISSTDDQTMVHQEKRQMGDNYSKRRTLPYASNLHFLFKPNTVKNLTRCQTCENLNFVKPCKHKSCYLGKYLRAMFSPATCVIFVVAMSSSVYKSVHMLHWTLGPRECALPARGPVRARGPAPPSSWRGSAVGRSVERSSGDWMGCNGEQAHKT